MSRLLELDDLHEFDRRLVITARDASQHAYAPYSGFAVGAAVQTEAGRVFCGSNLENAAYGASLCAEVAAIAGAISAGDFDLRVLAVVGHKFTDPIDCATLVTPCGNCRQVIAEAARNSRCDIRILSSDGALSAILVATISEFLPAAFGPDGLFVAGQWAHNRSRLLDRVRQLRQANRTSAEKGRGGK
jgi:cytidine deaminase